MSAPGFGFYTFTRLCGRCGERKPLKGGRTGPGGKTWTCGDCAKRGKA